MLPEQRVRFIVVQVQLDVVFVMLGRQKGQAKPQLREEPP